MARTPGKYSVQNLHPDAAPVPTWQIVPVDDPTQCVAFLSTCQTGDLKDTAEFLASAPDMEEEIARLKAWVADLQSGMYINCVYCGHRYGPDKDTPVAMADVLKAHIEKCPAHPLSKAKSEIEILKGVLLEMAEWMESHDINEFDEEGHPLEKANRLLNREGK